MTGHQVDLILITPTRKPQSRPRWLLLIYSFQFRSAFRASASPSPTLLPSPSPTSFGS